MTHPSVIEKGNILKCKIVSASPRMFGCHLCPRFATKSERAIQRHFLNHEANAVHFDEQIICRCNLPCRPGGHFHCSICGKTLIRKDNVEPHLINCKKKWHLAQLAWDPSCQPPSPDVLSLYMEHSYLLPPSVYAVKFDHTYIMRQSPESPAVDTDIAGDEEAPSEPEEPELPSEPEEPEEPAAPSEPEEPAAPSQPEEPEAPSQPEEPEAPSQPEEPEPSSSTPSPPTEEPVTPEKEEPISKLPPTRVKCPHCPLVLYKRNLAVHIKRKHSQVKDVTAQSPSKSLLSLTNRSVSTQSEYLPTEDGEVFQCTCRARTGQSNAC